LQQRAAGLLLCARRIGVTDQLLHGAQQQKCALRHVFSISWVAEQNTDLFGPVVYRFVVYSLQVVVSAPCLVS